MMWWQRSETANGKPVSGLVGGGVLHSMQIGGGRACVGLVGPKVMSGLGLVGLGSLGVALVIQSPEDNMAVLVHGMCWSEL